MRKLAPWQCNANFSYLQEPKARLKGQCVGVDVCSRKLPRPSVNVNAPCQCDGTQPHAGLTGCRERQYERATYSTENTASVELASVAGGATAAKPEALEPWAGLGGEEA